MRKHIRNILPDAPGVAYKQVQQNPQRKPWAVTTVLDVSKRKFYQQLKRDVQRFRRMGVVPNGVAVNA